MKFHKRKEEHVMTRAADRILRGWRVGESRGAEAARSLMIERLGIPAYDAAAADARLGELVGIGCLVRRIEGGQVIYVRTDPPVPMQPKERRPSAHFVSENGEVTAWPFSA